MKKTLLTLLSAIALLPAMAGNNNVAPWGWATCSDEAGTAYTLSGGNFADANKVTLTALGGGQSDDTQIKRAIAQNDIIILDGSNGDFTIEETMKLASTKNKTIIGINNARLCTKFYLTAEDNHYLANQGLDGLSSTKQISGTLPDGTYKESVDERAFYTMKAMMELQYQKTGEYKLPNKAGIFLIEATSENIIIRNLSLIGPGAVDIDGADLITNQGQHVWIDHCTFQDSQDGALDSKKCDWSTYTYNHFYYTSRSYSHAYTCGCGWADGTMTLHLTFASNMWGEGCMRRLPQCGDCYVHLVNNYHNCPGNDAAMTINGGCKALVEGNYAANGVNKPLTGEGTRQVTVRDNSFSASSIGSEVTVPYQYNKIAAADVPATLTGSEGAGATLGNDPNYILSTITTVNREESGETVYVMQKGDGHISAGGTINEVDGITLTFDNANWTPAGKALESPITTDGVELNGYYAQAAANGDKVIFSTTKPGTLTIIYGGAVSTSKKLQMSDENSTGLTATVISTGAQVEHNTAPAAEIAQWDGVKYTLEANKTYTFATTGTKWRLAAFKYVIGSTGIKVVNANVNDNDNFYNLQGVRVTNPQKGVYIQNGKKVIIK